MKTAALPNDACRALIVFCLASLAAGAALAAPPPLEAFGRIPQISHVAMNPKGDLLAWSDSSGPTQKIVFYDLHGSALKRTLDVGSNMKLRAIDWADDNTVSSM